MAGGLLTEPVIRAIDANGLAVAGAKLFFYLTGTTTPTNTYTSSTLGTPNANPVVADSGGLFAPIYMDPAVTYRVQLKTNGGSLIEDIDPFSIAANNPTGGVTSGMLAAGAAVANIGFTPADVASAIATGRHAMVIKADAMIPRTTNGPAPGSTESATNKTMITGYDFDAATQEHLCILIPMPKSVSVTSFTARFRWTALSGSGNIIWGCGAVGVGDGDSLDAALGGGVTAIDTLTGTSQLCVSPETTAITVGGSPQAQDILIIVVYREAANVLDTLNADGRLLALELFLNVTGTTDT